MVLWKKILSFGFQPIFRGYVVLGRVTHSQNPEAEANCSSYACPSDEVGGEKRVGFRPDPNRKESVYQNQTFETKGLTEPPKEPPENGTCCPGKLASYHAAVEIWGSFTNLPNNFQIR